MPANEFIEAPDFTVCIMLRARSRAIWHGYSSDHAGAGRSRRVWIFVGRHRAGLTGIISSCALKNDGAGQAGQGQNNYVLHSAH
jgi:hypothetical protein